MNPHVKKCAAVGFNRVAYSSAAHGIFCCAIAMSVLRGQTPQQTREIHDRLTAIIHEIADRPMTPGDTFVAWTPDAGKLFSTVAIDARGVRSSLLRGDGMIGTADVRWTDGRPSHFDVEWTNRDSVSGRAMRAREAHGVLEGSTLHVVGTTATLTPVPATPWAVADFGMEEQLVPLVRVLTAGDALQIIPVFRPWLSRWDSVSVTVRDTAGVRTAELVGADRSHEVMVLTDHGDLLCILRFDQPDERRPLEGSSRYQEYSAERSVLIAIARHYAAGQSKSPESRR